MAEISHSIIVELVKDLQHLTDREVSDTLLNMVDMNVIYDEEMEEIISEIQKAKEKPPKMEEKTDEIIEELVTEADEIIEDMAEEIEEPVKISKIIEKNNKWYVESEKGKNLGGGYKTKEEAKARLKQVEYFKQADIYLDKAEKLLKKSEWDDDWYSDMVIDGNNVSLGVGDTVSLTTDIEGDIRGEIEEIEIVGDFVIETFDQPGEEPYAIITVKWPDEKEGPVREEFNDSIDLILWEDD